MLEKTFRLVEGDGIVAPELKAAASRLMPVGFVSAAVNLLMLAGPLYMLQIYDRVLASRNMATLAALTVLIAGAYALQAWLDALRGRMLTRIGALFDAALQRPIHTTLAVLPLRGAGPVLAQQPLRDLDQCGNSSRASAPPPFSTCPSRRCSSSCCSFCIRRWGWSRCSARRRWLRSRFIRRARLERAARLASEAAARRQALAEATQRNAEVVCALGLGPRLEQRWVMANERYLQDSIGAAEIAADLGSIAKAVRFALQSAMLGAGACLVVWEQASGGVMIASSILMGRALAPIEIALGAWKQFVAAQEGIGRLSTLLNAAQPAARPMAPPASPRRAVTVESLAVAPPGGGPKIIADVGFTLAAGCGLALLGPSASGKSTLSRALAGVYPPCNGSIRLDDAALENWPRADLARHIGYLPQDVGLIDGTVAENIARFDPEATDAEIVAAARVAGAHDMILSLPDGYGARVGSGALSAGQRQRVGLARAVFRDPFLVVLDEPNANLDNDGEAALGAAIMAIRRRGGIVVVVSHRANVMQHLDMALVLFNGAAVAFGARDAVFERLGRIARAPRSGRRGGARAGGAVVMTLVSFDRAQAAVRAPRPGCRAGRRGACLRKPAISPSPFVRSRRSRPNMRGRGGCSGSPSSSAAAGPPSRRWRGRCSPRAKWWSNPMSRKISHPGGGVVAEIRARDGQHVAQGAVLARLDPTQARATLDVLTAQLDEALARAARLEAERDEARRFPRRPLGAQLWRRRRSACWRPSARPFTPVGPRAPARRRRWSRRRRNCASAWPAWRRSAARAAGRRNCWRANFPACSRCTTASSPRWRGWRRCSARPAQLEGEGAELSASIDESRSKIDEVGVQTLRVDRDFRADVLRDLGEAVARAAELSQRVVAARDQLERLELRAPVSGTVHRSALHTVGAAAEPARC